LSVPAPLPITSFEKTSVERNQLLSNVNLDIDNSKPDFDSTIELEDDVIFVSESKPLPSGLTELNSNVKLESRIEPLDSGFIVPITPVNDQHLIINQPVTPISVKSEQSESNTRGFVSIPTNLIKESGNCGVSSFSPSSSSSFPMKDLSVAMYRVDVSNIGHSSQVGISNTVIEQPSIINCYKCTICPKIFSRKQNLEHHQLNTHSKVVTYNCLHFTAIFSDKSAFTDHQTVHKPFPDNVSNFPNPNTIICIVCNVKLYSYRRYLKHLRQGICNCLKEQQFVCHICEEHFSTLLEYITDLQKHEESEKFYCIKPDCLSVFSRKNNLTAHIEAGKCAFGS